MGKYSWIGPYEIIKDNPEKFAKFCTSKVRANKRIAKTVPKPKKVVLWNFIGNFRDNVIPVGEGNPPIMGYNNLEYMNLFQGILQEFWKLFEPEFSRILSIVPLSQANNVGLYDPKALKEQFPGSGNGNAPGYRGGSFNQRQIGGWRWFSLILDYNNWYGEWDIRQKPEKMNIKEEKIEKIAPMYNHPYIYSKGKWVKDKKSPALYGRPSGCKFLPRRYNIPIKSESKTLKSNEERYKNFTNTIVNELETQWTLNVWNIISFGYKVLKKSVTLEMKPEINIDIGRIDEHLNQHIKEVYHIKVGLPDKYKLSLPLYIKKKLNPMWSGYAKGIDTILSEPYSRLVDLAILKLKELLGYDFREDNIFIVEDTEKSQETDDFLEFEEIIEAVDPNYHEEERNQEISENL